MFCKDDFVIIDSLGSGSFGQVKKALYKNKSKYYAIKSSTKEKFSTAMAVAEFEMLKKLNCKHIVKCFGFFFTENGQLVHGILQLGETDLRRENDKKWLHLFNYKNCSYRVNLDESILTNATTIVYSILQALKYLKSNFIIHRDLKPENILSRDGKYKIADLGLAVRTNGTSLKDTAGTLFYQSPEQIGKNGYSYEVDLWALGLIVYELIYPFHPFEDCKKNRQQLKFAIQNRMFSPFQRHRCSNENSVKLFYTLADISHRCMNKRPKSRPSIAECLEKIENVLQELQL